MKDSDIILEIFQDFIEIATETKEERMFAESKKVTAPDWMKAAVKKGKKIREGQPKSNQCCERTGLMRASQIENGDNLSLKTIKRMASFFARHGEGDLGNKESKKNQALLLWGSADTKEGVKKAINWCERQIEKLET